MSRSTQSRKLQFDDYTGKFYFEDKIESIERRCGYYQRQAATKNKSYEQQMKEVLKKNQDKRCLIEMQLLREKTSAEKYLQDLQAYRQVLERISLKNQNDAGNNANLGKYGPDMVYKALLPNIAQEKVKLTPRYMHQKQIATYRAHRRRLSVFDRNMSLEDVCKVWDGKKRPIGHLKQNENKNDAYTEELYNKHCQQKQKRESLKLILPPLEPPAQRHKQLKIGSQSVCDETNTNKDMKRSNRADTNSRHSLEVLFVTNTPLPELF